jgi:hypothetical protein
MNVLPKSSVVNIGVEYMTYFKNENAMVASSFHTNAFFFKRYVSEPAMLSFELLLGFFSIY